MNIFQQKWQHILLLYSITGTVFGSNQLSVNNWEVDGQHGQVHVKGSLTESPCRIAMHSTYQDIEINNLQKADFSQVGSIGSQYPFYIELLDCLANPVKMKDKYTGNMIWGTDQPAFSIKFMATEDENRSKYIAAKGVAGLGLMLTDKQGNEIALGEYIKPRLLPQGQSILAYNVIPVRTAAIMASGKFTSVIGFQLNYD